MKEKRKGSVLAAGPASVRLTAAATLFLLLAMLQTVCFIPASAPAPARELEAPSAEIVPDPEPEPVLETPEPVLLGTFRVTAYCSCEICCGNWAKNRPGGIVYGAAGVELTPGVSAASPLPFGTVVEVEGLGEYVVQDRPAQWVVEKYGENQLDIYLGSHEAAYAFGLQYLRVYLKEDP